MTEFYVKYSNYIDSSLVDEINGYILKDYSIDRIFGCNMYYNSYSEKYKSFIKNIFKNKDIKLLKELKRCNFKIPCYNVNSYIGSIYINKYKECLFEDEINFLNEYYHQNDFKELFSHFEFNIYEYEKEEWTRQKRRLELQKNPLLKDNSFVNDNLLLKRVEKLEEEMKKIKENKYIKKENKKENKKDSNNNIGKWWTIEEEEILWMNIKVHSIEEVAKLHKRTPKGIKMRLQKIILYKIYNDLLDCNEIKKYIKYIMGEELQNDNDTINGELMNQLIKNFTELN